MVIDSFEAWHFISVTGDPVVPLCEAFRGQDIVTWYGSIERQIQAMVDKYRNNKQFEDAAKAEQFLITWRRHQITGSINRGPIEALEAAAAQMAVDKWKSQNYFGALRDQLRKLVASEEELPRMPDASVANMPPSGMPGPTGAFGGTELEPSASNPAGEAPPEEKGGPAGGPPGGPAGAVPPLNKVPGAPKR